MLRLCMFMFISLSIFAVTACGNNQMVHGEGAGQGSIAALPDRIEMFFIYEELCVSCDGTEEINALARQHLSDTDYPYVLETINIFETGGMARFEILAQELLDVAASSLELPVLIVNGLAFQGMNAIRNNFNEAFLVAGHDLFERGVVFHPRYQRTGDALFDGFYADPEHITLVYFYRIVCPACIEIEPLLQALPDTVSIDGADVAVDLIRINTRSGNNRERVMAFFDAFDVPNEYRFVPIVFTASGFYTGPEAITALITESLADADHIGLTFP